MKLSDLFEEETKSAYGDFSDRGLSTFIGTRINSKINATFKCNNNGLTSLEGGPKRVIGDFECKNNKLTDLKGSPERVIGKIDASNNPELSSLEGVTPEIDDNLVLYNCPRLTSLKGIHKHFKGGYLKGVIMLPNSINSHLLGLVLIPGLLHAGLANANKTRLADALKIINNYLNRHIDEEADVIQCQQELIDAGLKAFAQL